MLCAKERSMSDIVKVDDNNFESEVNNSKLPVLVYFGAIWCGPCLRQFPLLEKFAPDNLGRIKVCKIDIDDVSIITSKLGIRSVPTIMIFNLGKIVATKVGLTSLADINVMLSDKLGI